MELNNPSSASTMDTPNVSPSNASNPDLDWSQVRETISLICVAIVQIKTSLAESGHSMSYLTESFTRIATMACQINNDITASDTAESNTAIVNAASEIQQEINGCITSFQFYDRITQRLDHVSEGLLDLNKVLGDPAHLYNPNSWKEIQDGIKSSYSMEEERIMFEHVMLGASVEEALEVYNHNFRNRVSTVEEQNSEDDIELF